MIFVPPRIFRTQAASMLLWSGPPAVASDVILHASACLHNIPQSSCDDTVVTGIIVLLSQSLALRLLIYTTEKSSTHDGWRRTVYTA